MNQEYNLFPFDSNRKRMSSIHDTAESTLAFVKGAPKEMLSLCNKININGEVKKLTKEILDEYFKV